MTDQDTSRTAGSTATTSPRQRAIEAYENARQRTVDTLGDAPFIAIAGGIAAGALLAALLPRTDTETRLIRPTARRVKQSARSAVDAARTTGTERLGELGISRDKGEETIRNLLGSLTDAAKASGQAAVDAVRNKG